MEAIRFAAGVMLRIIKSHRRDAYMPRGFTLRVHPSARLSGVAEDADSGGRVKE